MNGSFLDESQDFFKKWMISGKICVIFLCEKAKEAMKMRII